MKESVGRLAYLLLVLSKYVILRTVDSYLFSCFCENKSSESNKNNDKIKHHSLNVTETQRNEFYSKLVTVCYVWYLLTIQSRANKNNKKLNRNITTFIEKWKQIGSIGTIIFFYIYLESNNKKIQMKATKIASN